MNTMITDHFNKFFIMGISLGIGLFAAHPAHGRESFTTSMSFYHGFDLNTGMTTYDPRVLILKLGDNAELEEVARRPEWTFDFGPPADFHFEFTFGMALPVTLMAETGVQFAVLQSDDAALSDPGWLDHLLLESHPAGFQLAADDLVVMLTADGQYFTFGEFVYHPLEWTVQFTYAALAAVPEASTLCLLGAGLALMGVVFRKKRV